MRLPTNYTPKQRISIWIIIGLFTSIFCSISIVNHYMFRTEAFDLGIYNNMIYTYSHLKFNYTTIQQPIVWHAFSDHFEPIFFLISPLYYLLGSYTLICFQIASIILGGIGIMLWAERVTKNKNLAIVTLIQFYSMWGIYSALAFDFHNNVTAAMLIPWLALFIHQNQWKKVILIWVLILLCKENMALYNSFVCAGFSLHYFKDPQKRNRLILLSVLALMYFVVAIKMIIPFFQLPGAGYLYNDMYKSFGTTPSEILHNVVSRPGYLFAHLFENFTGNLNYSGIKSETHFAVLISGGIFLFYRPQFLVMLIPIYIQKMFNQEPTKWGINYHYSIEFVPVICMATLCFINDINQSRFKQNLHWLIPVATMFFTMSKLDSRVSYWYDKGASRFYQGLHYTQDFDAAALRKQLKRLPITEEDKVSAQNNLVPHLANRTHIYHYPYLGDAEYIILSPPSKTYPFNAQKYQYSLDTLAISESWIPFHKTPELLVYKKR